jgi:hypothetical protein
MRTAEQLSRTCFVAFVAFVMLSCRGGGSPIQPEVQSPDAASARAGLIPTDTDSGSHRLIGWFEVFADASQGILGAKPVRSGADHLNVTAFLERSPCQRCLRIESVRKSPDGTWRVDITVENPFSNPGFTAFDVRGIVIFTAGLEFPSNGVRVSTRLLGDAELLNADGYTSLYSPMTTGHRFHGYYAGERATPTKPESTVSAFKRHVSADPSNTRNALYAGDSATVTYRFWLPDTPFVFGYAIDASWAQPITSPVHDPMNDFPPHANCPEPWKIVVHELPAGGGLTSEGGSTIIRMDVYDWQGYDGVQSATIECPELFDGLAEAVCVGQGDAYTTYQAVIENENLVYGGDFTCLIRKQATENDPLNRPWLDLSAWQLTDVRVEPVSEPGEITPNAFKYRADYPRDIRIQGNYAYVLLSHSGINILDVSDPIHPVWLCSLSTSPLDVFELSDGYAYALDDDGDFFIYDVDPPELAHRVYSNRDLGAHSLQMAGNYCYLLGYHALYLFDISVPDQPFMAHCINLPQMGWYMIVADGYAYIYGYALLQIVDVDPFSLAHIVRMMPLHVSAHTINLVDGYLYLGTAIIDVDPPESAHVVGEMPNAIGHQRWWNGWLVDISRDLTFYDTADPASPKPIYRMPREDEIHGFDILGDYAYVPGPDYAFEIIDLNPPGAAHVVRSIMPIDGGTMALGEGYLYDQDFPDGAVSIIDIRSPGLAHVETVIWDTYGEEIGYYSNHIYIAHGDLDIYDVCDPLSASLVRSVDLPGTVRQLCIDGGRLYALADYYGWYAPYDALSIVDIQNPEDPMVLGWVEVEGARYFDADGDYVVVYQSCSVGYTGYYSNFSIISVNPPEEAAIVGELDPDLFPHIDALMVHNGYAYVKSYSEGITVVDIDPPEAAGIVNTISIKHAEAMYVVGEKLYVSAYEGGIMEVDISEPETATVRAQYFKGESFGQIIVDGDFLYTTENQGWGRIRIFKIW